MRKVDVNLFHKWTHQSEPHMKATAERLNIKLTGKFEDCVHCARAIAKKKKINKAICDIDTKPGERFAIDVTGSS